MEPQKKQARWYFGGIAAAIAACITHPLDLLKVHLQTQKEGKISMVKIAVNIFKRQGISALYNGLSASLCRQMTYSTTRFAIYDSMKRSVTSQEEEPSFTTKLGMATIAGAAGGIVGTPPDLVNVRMQNDIKLPPHKRRNYKHVFDGLWRVYREEGGKTLFSGASMATFRAALVTVGQLSFYDQVKIMLVKSGYFNDSPNAHFISSFLAGCMATTLAQPMDVIKTRAMNAKPGEYKNIWALVSQTMKLGFTQFFKGYLPGFARLGPHTILTIMILEQLRLHYGYIPTEKSN